MLINTSINNNNSFTTYSQINPISNNINYYENNIYDNYFPNNNIFNNLQNQPNINKLSSISV